MPKFTVYFETTASSSVTVEADNYDAAIDRAYGEVPRGVCAQCAGWGRAAGIDLPGEWEPSSVFDEDNNEVWTEHVEEPS